MAGVSGAARGPLACVLRPPEGARPHAIGLPHLMGTNGRGNALVEARDVPDLAELAAPREAIGFQT